MIGSTEIDDLYYSERHLTDLVVHFIAPFQQHQNLKCDFSYTNWCSPLSLHVSMIVFTHFLFCTHFDKLRAQQLMKKRSQRPHTLQKSKVLYFTLPLIPKSYRHATIGLFPYQRPMTRPVTPQGEHTYTVPDCILLLYFLIFCYTVSKSSNRLVV